MRIENFRRLIPVSFQFPDSKEHEIALVNLDDRIVHVWNEPLQRYIPAGNGLEEIILAQFNLTSIDSITTPNNVIERANRVWRETHAQSQAVKERVKQDELREAN